MVTSMMNKILRYVLLFLLAILSACASGPAVVSTPRETASPPRGTASPTPAQTPTHRPTSPTTLSPSPTHRAASPSATPSPSLQPTDRPAYLLLPDAELVYSATALDFDTSAYLTESQSFLSSYEQYLMITGWTPAAEVVEMVALENSINPRLLLALLEYQSGCVFDKPPWPEDFNTAMGAGDQLRKDLYGQLVWAAHVLSEGFYGWWSGTLEEIPFPDGSVFYPPANANPGTVAVQYFFAQLYERDTWEDALDPLNGFPALYEDMFGDPWARAAKVGELVPWGLAQPRLTLPFEPGKTWAYTSGPHRAFEGNGPLAALDFAPPMKEKGCIPTREWVTAVTSGLIVRSEFGAVIQDLDGDGDEQTGWVIFYLHIAEDGRVPVGTYLYTGGNVGHPSCEGGISTGTHLHIARKYNGVWIPADGLIPFVLNGWTAHAGEVPRMGTLTRGDQTVTANQTGAISSHITREEDEVPHWILGTGY